MIFLKKFSIAAIFILSGAVLCSCSGKKTEKADIIAAASDTEATSSSDEFSEENTMDSEIYTEIKPESVVPDLDKKVTESGKLIYDNAGLLDDASCKKCSEYLNELYSRYMINSAVVTTNDLGGRSVHEYAAEAYDDIFGAGGNGLLLLINNDTNEDYLYKAGACSQFISEDDETSAFYSATREIVGGDYESAILRIMNLGERCPENIFDYASVFTNEEVSGLEETIKSGGKEISFVTVNNTDNDSELIKTLYKRRYINGGGCLIMLDINTKKLTAYSDSNVPSDIAKSVSEANKSAEKGDYAAAAKIAVNGT